MADISRQARENAANKGQALPGGRFPIRNGEDLHNAIRAVGRAKGSHDTVRRFIIKRANALGMSSAIPANWNSDGSIK
jgi:NADH:ubiquinone oxidoreductase subunit